MIFLLVLGPVFVALATLLITLTASFFSLLLSFSFFLTVLYFLTSYRLFMIEIVLFFRYFLISFCNIFFFIRRIVIFFTLFNIFIFVSLRIRRPKSWFVGIIFSDFISSNLQSLMVKCIDMINVLLICDQMLFLLRF